ncbi:CCA tRNA nucleotidyltransferase [Chloroflexota bacterium]
MNTGRNIAGLINGLPEPAAEILREAGRLAEARGEGLWLAGGMVRDLLLGRESHDLDLVVRGDSYAIAEELAVGVGAALSFHRRFRTGTYYNAGWRVDIAMARRESYARPGALPEVVPGDIYEDLARRDLTINAMAASLMPDNFGELLDFYNGRRDLERKFIRVLHNNTFADDATRIWRCLRYGARLGFRLAPTSRKLIIENLAMLDTVSADRLRHELEMVLGEDIPERYLRRAARLGVLSRIYHGLRADDWLGRKYRATRRLYREKKPPTTIYLAIMAFRLDSTGIGVVTRRLNLPSKTAKILADLYGLAESLPELDSPSLLPSRICRLLGGKSAESLAAAQIATDSGQAKKHIRCYQKKLRMIKPFLGGDELIGLGVAWGPTVSAMLEKLRDARLDGMASTRDDEIGLVNGWLGRGSA